MKCKIFVDTPAKVQDVFNKWAKGKALTNKVIIHTLALSKDISDIYECIAIIVFHPENEHWDRTETK